MKGYTEDTEILTLTGWKAFKDIHPEEDTVIQLTDIGSCFPTQEYEIVTEEQASGFTTLTGENFIITVAYDTDFIVRKYFDDIPDYGYMRKPLSEITVEDDFRFPFITSLMEVKDIFDNDTYKVEYEETKVSEIKQEPSSYNGKVYNIRTDSGIIAVRYQGKMMLVGSLLK